MGINYKKVMSLGLLLVIILLVGLHALPVMAKAKKPRDPNLFGTVVTSRAVSSSIELPYDPLDGCEVTVQETNQKSVTDSHGLFYFVMKPGKYTLLVQKAGVGTVTKSVTVPKGEGEKAMVTVILNPGMTPGSTMANGVQGMRSPVQPGTAYICLALKAGQGAPAGSSTSYNAPMTTTQSYAQMMLLGQGNPFGATNTAAMNAQMPTTPFASSQSAMGFNQGSVLNSNPNSIMILNGDSPGNPSFKELSCQPFWAAFNASGTRLYISTSDRMIQVYDVPSENTLLTSIAAGGIVTDLRMAQNGNHIIATIMSASPNVMLIDPTSNAPQRSIVLPRMRTGEAGQPRAAVINREGTRMFVAMGTNSSGELLAIDLSTGIPEKALPVGANPCGMELSPDGRFLYIANAGSGDLSVVDAWTFQEMGRVRVGVSPQRVAITPDGSKVFVTNKGSDNVTILNGQNQSPIATVPVGKGPVGIACSSDGSKVFVTCTGSSTVSILDGRTGGVLNTSSPMPQSTPWGVTVCP
ncbi:MAG: beta-propeller fold lactonase family protein [Candidatus Bruticola sp.]